MKKYLLTALLGVFVLFGAFASADTVCTSDGFTAQNVNLNVGSDADSIEVNGITYYEYANSDIIDYCEDGCYILVNSTSPTIQYYGNGRTEGDYFPASFPFVYNASNVDDLATFYFYSTSEVESVSGNFSFSSSPITCTSSSEGDNSGGSLLPNGESDLSGIITGLNSTITEFIPYLVYLGLGIITVIIGFVAIRWLVNRTQAKIRGTFSSGRRRK